MKLFVSWSGQRSLYIAEGLREWLPKVIQSVKPWLSANDIEKGARWSNEMAKELHESGFGIVCVTPENLNAPWLNFEAGALSKVIAATRVCPYLLDVEPTDVTGPLAQFQCARTTRDETLRVMQAMNSALPEHRLTEAQLKETFDVWWPKLEEVLKTVPGEKAMAPKREERDLLQETLSVVREMSKEQQRLITHVNGISHWTGRLRSRSFPMPMDPMMTGVPLALLLADNVMVNCPNCGAQFSFKNNEHWMALEVSCPICHAPIELRRQEDGTITASK